MKNSNPSSVKVIIQIPCLNEEQTLPQTLADLPRSIEGVSCVEWLVIDDGSTDRTSEVAREHGVDHIVRLPSNRGLAAAFRIGLQTALELDADIIVNTDADNQYAGADIERLVRPILDDQADIVIGDRQIASHSEFGWTKKRLQQLGSWVVSRLSQTQIPDVTSGFRAFRREAALRLNILGDFTYTQETLIQAGLSNLTLVSVPVKVNPKTRPSRLFRSTFSYVSRSAATIMRIYTLYRPLKVFLLMAAVLFMLGFALGLRFMIFWLSGQSSGHIQSLILCAILLNLSFLLFILGVVADLISFNRRILEEIVFRTRKLTQTKNE